MLRRRRCLPREALPSAAASRTQRRAQTGVGRDPHGRSGEDLRGDRRVAVREVGRRRLAHDVRVPRDRLLAHWEPDVVRRRDLRHVSEVRRCEYELAADHLQSPSIATNSRIAAERALRPRSGENAACAATPWKITRFVTTPSELPPNSQSGSPEGCDDSTATESRNTPASIRSIFPPPLSSAGVPTSAMPTPRSFARSAASRNAPTFDI